jgi:RNA polymerase sigma-70 factor (ECF subfamily)
MYNVFMGGHKRDRTRSGCGGGHFATTHWSLVLALGAQDSRESREALETLCRLYWYPLYAYLRRQGHNPPEAEDLTQGFFVCLLERDALAAADPQRGRFRSFLLASLKHFVADQRDRDRAQKRGGGKGSMPLDIRGAEGRYCLEPADNLTAEKVFERRWAQTMLEMVLADLRRQYARDGKERTFERLKGFLRGTTAKGSYSQVGAELDMTEAAVRVAVHRLRRRYRKLVREQIAQTVASPEDVEDEIRHLFAAFEA